MTLSNKKHGMKKLEELKVAITNFFAKRVCPVPKLVYKRNHAPCAEGSSLKGTDGRRGGGNPNFAARKNSNCAETHEFKKRPTAEGSRREAAIGRAKIPDTN